MRISTKGFKEAVERLKELGSALDTQKFQQVLVSALEPMAEQAKSAVHSVTGRTVQATEVAAGRNAQYPSAYIRVAKPMASASYRGKPYFYPARVESIEPFFRPAILAGRAAARRVVRDGIEDVLHPYHSPVNIGGNFT